MAADASADRPTYRVALAVPRDDLELWAAESTYTEAEPETAVPVPDRATDLRVTMTGTPASTTAIELETVRGGYADGGAAFRWRQTGGAWLGWHGPSEWTDPSIIWQSLSGGLTALGAATLSNGRAVVAVVNTEVGERVQVVVEQASGTWGSPVVLSEMQPSSGTIDSIAVVVLPDDTILVMHEAGDGAIVCYQSTDLGVSFDFRPVRFVPSAGGPFPPWTEEHPVGGAYSGIFIAVAYDADAGALLLAISTGGGVLQLYGSDDLGHTWEQTGSNETPGSGPGWISLTWSAGVGFLLALYDTSSGHIRTYASAFSTSYTEATLVSTAGTGATWTRQDRQAFAHIGDQLCLLDLDYGATGDKAHVRVHQSPDGGATFVLQGSTSAAVGTVDVQQSIAFGATSRPGGGWLFVGAGFTVVARRMAGWSSLPTYRGAYLTDGAYAYGWTSDYAAQYGVQPHTTPDTDDGTIARVLSGVTVTDTAGLALAGTGTPGDEARWTYTPSGTETAWLTEVEIDLATWTVGRIDITGSSTTYRARVVVDVEAGTIGLYEVDDHTDFSVETLLGSTFDIPDTSTRIVVRMLLADLGSSGAYGSVWVRDRWALEWDEVAADEAIGATSGAVTCALILRGLDMGNDLNAKLWAWRFVDDRFEAGITDTLAPTDWSADPVYLTDGQSVSAVGLTRTGDTWTHTPGARYEADHLLPAYPSQRQGWVAQDDDDQVIAYRVPTGEHATAHALLIQATNARSVLVAVHTGGSWVTYGTINLYRPVGSYRKVGTRHVLLGTDTGTSDLLLHLRQDQLAGGTFMDDANGLHRIVGNSAGSVAGVTSGNGTAGVPVCLELATEPANSGGTCELWFPQEAAILHHAPESDIAGIRLTFKGHSTAGAVGGVLYAGNALVAPVTWLPENPDETRTEVLDMGAEILDGADGYDVDIRTAPDRRRWELQWARLLPMYAAFPADLDYQTTWTNGAPAITRWTTPQVLEGLHRQAGRGPVLYLPVVSFWNDAGSYGVQQLRDYHGNAAVVRLASDSVRWEGVTGHADSADQLVRMSTITLREVP